MPQPTSEIDLLVAFSRQVSAARAADEVLEALRESAWEGIRPDAIAIFHIGETGLPEPIATRGLAPEHLRACEDVDFLDSGLGALCVEAPNAPWRAHGTYLLVTAGGLFGAMVLLFTDPVAQKESSTVARGLTEIAAIAVDRADQTRLLEEKIDQLDRSRAALARAKQLEALGQMAAVIAHEVKNPLAGVKGALEILKGRLPVADLPIAEKLVTRLSDVAEMLDDLLIFARPRDPKRERIAIRKILDDVISGYRADPANSGVQIAFEGAHAMVNADPGMLRSVFLNLILNAGQAMEQNGTIDVEIETGPGRCEVVITDSGPGIPPELAETLFEPFVTTKTRGTGLGLPFVKRTIEAHEGTISLEDGPTGGARFRVRLPVV